MTGNGLRQRSGFLRRGRTHFKKKRAPRRLAVGLALGEDIADDLAVGQHGDDDVAARHGIGGALRGLTALVYQFLQGIRGQVEAGNLVAGLQQIGRHRQTHLSKPDKGDTRCRLHQNQSSLLLEF